MNLCIFAEYMRIYRANKGRLDRAIIWFNASKGNEYSSLVVRTSLMIRKVK